MLSIKLKSFVTKKSIVIESLTLGVRSTPVKFLSNKSQIPINPHLFLQNRNS